MLTVVPSEYLVITPMSAVTRKRIRWLWKGRLAVGKINKFLLKTPAQQQSARQGIERYRHCQDQLEELSQINAELLRRGEPLAPQP